MSGNRDDISAAKPAHRRLDFDPLRAERAGSFILFILRPALGESTHLFGVTFVVLDTSQPAFLNEGDDHTDRTENGAEEAAEPFLAMWAEEHRADDRADDANEDECGHAVTATEATFPPA